MFCNPETAFQSVSHQPGDDPDSDCFPDAEFSVDEARDMAMLLEDVNAAGICVSYGGDGRRIVGIYEARAACSRPKKNWS